MYFFTLRENRMRVFEKERRGEYLDLKDKKAIGGGIYVPKDTGIARTKAHLNFYYFLSIT
jgi:hypothetical protein